MVPRLSIRAWNAVLQSCLSFQIVARVVGVVVIVSTVVVIGVVAVIAIVDSGIDGVGGIPWAQLVVGGCKGIPIKIAVVNGGGVVFFIVIIIVIIVDYDVARIIIIGMQSIFITVKVLV